LADAIKRPIIPLLLEPMPWPPEGPMSMAFTQLLYVDFCQPSTDVQHDWNCAQFDQLVKQIHGHTDKQKTVRITRLCQCACAHLLISALNAATI